jgi:hypothetical protein
VSAPNPFSTGRVRPGAIPYRFPAGKDTASTMRRLKKNAWRGQIVGPHGSGKSALVATLIAALETSGRPTLLFELHDGQRRLPVNLRQIPELAAGTILFVDGYEQLNRWSRFRLRRFCRRRSLGLVVTAHTSVGFPDLLRTTTSLALAGELVGQLLGEAIRQVTTEEVSRRFRSHGGDLREVFFDLYDLYEQRKPNGRASSAGTEG